MKDQLWIEPVGDLIIARLRGEPTEALLRTCQQQVLDLVKDARRGKVLYDVLEMVPPPPQLTFVQRGLDEELGDVHLRRAIVVPNTRLAYLARIAFGTGDDQVFYNDITAAIQWLNADNAAARLRKA
ncbi:MAG: hypothetical protein KA352_09460 [Flavobacteriales bacterium]|nr:hypothetical protein [Flavobacteriales bacterium]